MNTYLKLGVAGVFAALSSCAAVSDEALTTDDSEPAVQTSQAIVHGALDRGRHPSVVALVAREGAIEHLCTASVIAPDVLLTARHCVADVRVDRIECPPRVSQVGRSLAAASLQVFLGDDVRTSLPAAYGRSIHVPYTDALCDADIAVVTLDRKLSVAPMPLARATRPVEQRSIVAVGYGKTSNRSRVGVRRFRSEVPIVTVSPTELEVGESTCSGDSGGPAIDPGTGEILGVLSRGSVDCAGDRTRNVYVRVSAFLDLIDRIAGPPAPVDASPYTPPADLGEPCTDGESCATGLCVLTGGYCSRACGPEVGRCPAGFRCARRTTATEGVCARRT